jgi:hypothetical protein
MSVTALSAVPGDGVNSEYFRKQAATCRALANAASDPKAREALLEIAADYEQRAVEAERQKGPRETPKKSTDDKSD